MRLRDYQADGERQVYDEWAAGAVNVLLVEPTGAGKTVIFSEILRKHAAPSVAIAHRQELVSQIAMALARDEVRHKIIGPKNVVRMVSRMQQDELGRAFVDQNSSTAVAGVDTLKSRSADYGVWGNSVTRWVQDEGHHVLAGNKWGTAAAMFPNALGLGVTAAATRADGRGLGRHADGLYDSLIVGPSGRELIQRGYLTDYRIFAPPSDLDLSDVNVDNSGEYGKKKLKNAVRRSHIIGDVVKHYLRIAPGKLGITFATDVETATDIAKRFNEAGVPAAVVHAKTPDAERARVLRQFKNRELLQLVNVDLFGEGFDLPALEVVSMARPTLSYQLYTQQFGRSLRVMVDAALAENWDAYTDEQRRGFIALSIKPHAIIIDHVGNVERHKLPDAPRLWSLDAREKRGSESRDAIPVTTCLNPECLSVYERIYKMCPFCGHVPIPQNRSAPNLVDGDLVELDPATLAALRGEIERVDQTPAEYRAQLAARHVPLIGQMGHVNKFVAMQEAQKKLRTAMAWWAGWQRSLGRPDSESYRRFYFKFGIDVLSAQALGTKDAEALHLKLAEQLDGVI